MKNLFYISSLFLCLVFSCKENTDDGDYKPKPDEKDTTEVSYHEKARQTFDLIQQYYKIGATGLYLENYPKQSEDPQCSYLWCLDGMLTVSNQLKALNYTDAAINYPFTALDKYYDTQRTPAAYASFPVQYSLNDRFYDDNAIVALDLIEAYEITGDKAYLDRAEQIVNFSMTGESNDCGGGIFWVEQYRNRPENDFCNKAVCASVYTTMYLLKLYQHTKKTAYLQFAQRIYNWLNQTMQDPVDKLFWNDIRVRDNYINPTKWTYNSGAMITNNVLLYEITNDNSYLAKAQEIAGSAFRTFTRSVNGKTFFPAHDSWFNVCLFRGYLDLYKHDPSALNYVNTFIVNADYAWKNARNQYDLFYEDWSGQNPGRDKWLLHQAAVAEAYARIALLKGEKAQ